MVQGCRLPGCILTGRLLNSQMMLRDCMQALQRRLRTGGGGDARVLEATGVEQAVAPHHLRPGGRAQAVQPAPLHAPGRVLHGPHTRLRSCFAQSAHGYPQAPTLPVTTPHGRTKLAAGVTVAHRCRVIHQHLGCLCAGKTLSCNDDWRPYQHRGCQEVRSRRQRGVKSCAR